MRVWIISVATFVVAFTALRALGVALGGEGSLLTAVLQGVAILLGVSVAGVLTRRHRAKTREGALLGAERDWNAAGASVALVATLIATAVGTVWMSATGNYAGLVALVSVTIITLVSFWIGRKAAS